MALQTNITNLATRAATEDKSLRTLINGNVVDLSSLTTTAKSNLVAAINEVAASVAGASGINDAVTNTSTSWSSSKTQAEIDEAIAAILDTAPGTLDTLNELAAALGDDPNFATTVTTALGLKAPLASPTFTGTPAAPTATPGTNTTQLATTAFVTAATPDASSTVKGKVELATDAEAIAGASTTLVVTPANLLAVVGDSTTDFVATFNAGLV